MRNVRVSAVSLADGTLGCQPREQNSLIVIRAPERGHGELPWTTWCSVRTNWKITHNKRHSHPYETQADAISSAIDAAHDAHREGGLFQVLVQGQDLLFRTEWT